MWVVKEKIEKDGRKVYRKTWKLSPKTKRNLWEFACYVVVAIMFWVAIWYE